MMKSTYLAAVFISFLALVVSISANAALVSVLDGKAVYDTDLNITWIADANLAATNTFGLARNVDLGPIPGVNTEGVISCGDFCFDPGNMILDGGDMTWGGALKWIDAMNSANYLGYSDWRLPATIFPDVSCQYQTNSFGYSCGGSELGHLFYDELGGVATSSIESAHNANYGLFINLLPGWYWSGTESPVSVYDAWWFSFSDGYQYPSSKYNFLLALAVRDGQVAAVPVPAAVWLFGGGLVGLMSVACKRKAN